MSNWTPTDVRPGKRSPAELRRVFLFWRVNGGMTLHGVERLIGEYADAWEAEIKRLRELRADVAHILAWAGQRQDALTSRQVADAVMHMCQDALYAAREHVPKAEEV